MKFYRTILLIILFIPGLTDCQGCAEAIATEECKDSGQQLSKALSEMNAAGEAFHNATADKKDETWTEYMAKSDAYRTALESHQSLNCPN